MFDNLKQLVSQLDGVENNAALNAGQKKVSYRKTLQLIKVEAHQLRKTLQQKEK